MIVFELIVIDFANHIFSWRDFYMSKETIKRSSKVIGEIRVRSAKWGHDVFFISGPERITTIESKYLTIESRYRTGTEKLYVHPGECRRIAEKLYVAEMRFKPWGKLRFTTIADIFSLGSIMNGVAII